MQVYQSEYAAPQGAVVEQEGVEDAGQPAVLATVRREDVEMPLWWGARTKGRRRRSAATLSRPSGVRRATASISAAARLHGGSGPAYRR